jgi:hypothetical protein
MTLQQQMRPFAGSDHLGILIFSRGKDTFVPIFLWIFPCKSRIFRSNPQATAPVFVHLVHFHIPHTPRRISFSSKVWYFVLKLPNLYLIS